MLLVVFVILAFLLRAVVAPLVLIATVVLSFLASLGVSAVVFDKVFGFKGQDQSFPLFVFVFLVALGIDYNIFLMSRIREESIKHGTRRGAVIGLATTGGVITSAGLVLAGTFAVLARCRWWPSPRSASRWPSACCSTRWWCGHPGHVAHPRHGAVHLVAECTQPRDGLRGSRRAHPCRRGRVRHLRSLAPHTFVEEMLAPTGIFLHEPGRPPRVGGQLVTSAVVIRAQARAAKIAV